MFRYVTVCICLIFCVNNIICWKAILDRYELLYQNTKYLNISAKIGRYNHTTVAGSLYLHVYCEVSKETNIEIRLYAELSNTYRELPVVIRRKICDILNLEYKWVKNEIKGNFPERCPIGKGFYYIEDYVPDVSRFPKKAWSAENFMVTFKLYGNGELHIYGKLYIKTTDQDEYYKE